ncbi:hypothetical protein G9A89_020744 [Geosiphon pyriformis]|nr:hypothetical protein G9A89_020744 [Geosiphon pyriformis]
MSSISHLFVPRGRKVDFQIDILIEDLANVPLLTGLFYVKWNMKCPEKTSGATERAPIKDYSVFWNYKLSNAAQLVVGKDGMLMPCEFRVNIKQELNGGKVINKIGSLSLNLAEYVGSGKTTRKYLLQNSKINSTLKLTIDMKKTFGDVEFKVPQLKKPQIFGGITGIITDRKELQDDQRSIRGFRNRSNFGPHDLSNSRSATSLKSAYFTQGAHHTPPPIFTSSLLTNSFLRDMGDRSPTDVIEDIFLRVTMNIHSDDENGEDNGKLLIPSEAR